MPHADRDVQSHVRKIFRQKNHFYMEVYKPVPLSLYIHVFLQSSAKFHFDKFLKCVLDKTR